jgi:hypothetical protein
MSGKARNPPPKSAQNDPYPDLDPQKSIEHAVRFAHIMYSHVAEVWEQLHYPQGPSEEAYAEYAVTTVLRLWLEIPIGRNMLKTWSDKILLARGKAGLDRFRCPLGDFESAVYAVQRLAEEVLAELWWLFHEELSSSCAEDDQPFEKDGPLPPFKRAHWRAILPALHLYCKELTNRWELEGQSTCWHVGLRQDAACVRVWLQPTNPKDTETDIQWSKPLSPGQLAVIFQRNEKTIARWLNKDKLRHQEINSKAYLIDLRDLPANVLDKHRNSKVTDSSQRATGH